MLTNLPQIQQDIHFCKSYDELVCKRVHQYLLSLWKMLILKIWGFGELKRSSLAPFIPLLLKRTPFGKCYVLCSFQALIVKYLNRKNNVGQVKCVTLKKLYVGVCIRFLCNLICIFGNQHCSNLARTLNIGMINETTFSCFEM